MTAQLEPQTLAEVKDYYGLIDALRARARERQLALSSPAIAAVAGLPDGYIAKLLGPGKVRTFAWASMGPVLAVLGAKLILVVDQEAVEALDHRLPKWNATKVHARSKTFTLSGCFLKKRARLGGLARAKVHKDKLAQRERWRLAKRALRAKRAVAKRAGRRRRPSVGRYRQEGEPSRGPAGRWGACRRARGAVPARLGGPADYSFGRRA
jgi:hypothetical protein